jgi:hypothetical protein
VRKLCDSCRLLLHTRGSLRADHTPVPLLPEDGGADGYASLAPLIAASGPAGGRLRSFAVEYGSNNKPAGESSPEMIESISPSHSRRHHRPIRTEMRRAEKDTATEENSTTPLIASHEVSTGVTVLTTPGNSVTASGTTTAATAIPFGSSADASGFDRSRSPDEEAFSPPPPFITSKSLKDVVE